MAYRLFTGMRRYYATDGEQIVSFTLPELRDQWVREQPNRRALTAPEAYRAILRAQRPSARSYYAVEVDENDNDAIVMRFATRAERDAWVEENPEQRRVMYASRAYTRYVRATQRTNATP